MDANPQIPAIFSVLRTIKRPYVYGSRGSRFSRVIKMPVLRRHAARSPANKAR